jgi:hypothetical protein
VSDLSRLARENAGPLVFAALLALHLAITVAWWPSPRPQAPSEAEEWRQHLKDLRIMQIAMDSAARTRLPLERWEATGNGRSLKMYLEAMERVRQYDLRHGGDSR